MAGRLHHEMLYRGESAMKKLASTPVWICGAGALGGTIAVSLARMGMTRITVVDRDRVEEHNVGTQIYGLEDVGARKVDMLRNMLYRDLGCEVAVVGEELTERNIAKLLRGASLVVDTFDNSRARGTVAQWCTAGGVACVHAGVNEGYGEVVWNERYVIPSDGGIDVCDYPLSRSLITLVASVASDVVVRFSVDGVRESYAITLQDFRIALLEN